MTPTPPYRCDPAPDRWLTIPASTAARQQLRSTLVAGLEQVSYPADATALVDALLAQAAQLGSAGPVFLSLRLPIGRPVLALVVVLPARGPNWDYLLETADAVRDDAAGRPHLTYLDDGVGVLRHDEVDGVLVASRTLAVRRADRDVLVLSRTTDLGAMALLEPDLLHLLESTRPLAPGEEIAA